MVQKYYRDILDTGQRDNFYDIARIVRKGNAVAPTGRLWLCIITLNMVLVTSYRTYSGDYKEIPTYTAIRVDPRFVTFW